MSSPANVHSSEAILAVRRAMAAFVERVADALTELDAQMRRMMDWLEHDRPRYWKTQIRLAHEQVHEAQQALHRCLMFPIADEQPSCYEERAALKRAQARLAYCETKAERVRQWQRTVRHELFEYEGRISQLVRLIEVDAPQSMGVLDRIVRHLEDYQSVRALEPAKQYDDVSLAKDIWPAATSPGQAVSAPVDDPEDASVAPSKSDTISPRVAENSEG